MYISPCTLPMEFLYSYCRGSGDENRALSYGKAFSASNVPLEIVECVNNQSNLEYKASKISKSSYRAILSKLPQYLLYIELQTSESMNYS